MEEPKTNEAIVEEELGRGKRQRKQRITADYEYIANIIGKGGNGRKYSGNAKTIKVKNEEDINDNKNGRAAGKGGASQAKARRVSSIGQKHTRLMKTISAPAPNRMKLPKFAPSEPNDGKHVLQIHRTFRDDQGREYNQTEVVEDARLVQNYLKMRMLCSHEQLLRFAFDCDEAIEDFKHFRHNMRERIRYKDKKEQKDNKNEEQQQPQPGTSSGTNKRVRFANDVVEEMDEGVGSGTSTSGIVF